MNHTYQQESHRAIEQWAAAFFGQFPHETASSDEEEVSQQLLAARMYQAVTKTAVLYSEATRQYAQDFFELQSHTIRILFANWMSRRQPTPEYDPSAFSAFAGLSGIFTDMMTGAISKSFSYHAEKSLELAKAAATGMPENIVAFWEQQAKVLDIVVNQNPEAVKKISEIAGFHFENTREYTRIAETERAILYRVLPIEDGVVIDEERKPVLHVAPFILREDIIALLPHSGLSLVHAFAHESVPTYVFHVKNIMQTPAVQEMTGEDMVRDIKYFAELLMLKHGFRVSLVGTCQGAYFSLLAYLTGELDGCVNVLIQNVPPNDLTRSPRFKKNWEMIPESRKNLRSIAITLPNGNQVVSGHPASLSMRLSDFGEENPASALIRDLIAAERGVTNMGAAITKWLQGIVPMPLRITEISQRSVAAPIGPDGILPVMLFGKRLCLSHLVEQGIKFHVVVGQKDNVVEPAVALAPFTVPCIKEYAGATYRIVPNAGHVAPMTTCAQKSSKNYVGNEGGSLWFHLKQEAEAFQKTS